jgi:hypothetical protein
MAVLTYEKWLLVLNGKAFSRQTLFLCAFLTPCLEQTWKKFNYGNSFTAIRSA